MFFHRLLSSGMLAGRHDHFLAHAHLGLKLLRMNRPKTSVILHTHFGRLISSCDTSALSIAKRRGG